MKVEKKKERKWYREILLRQTTYIYSKFQISNFHNCQSHAICDHQMYKMKSLLILVVPMSIQIIYFIFYSRTSSVKISPILPYEFFTTNVLQQSKKKALNIRLLFEI